jgi:hypothetical protein
MSKDFRCESCKRPQESLHMRNTDGKWVCPSCIPAAELKEYPRLRERLTSGARRTARTQKKAA